MTVVRKTSRRPASRLLAIHDPAGLAALIERAIETFHDGRQSIACRAVGIPEATLSRLRSHQVRAITMEVNLRLRRLWKRRTPEAHAWLEALRACLQSPAARALEEQGYFWSASGLLEEQSRCANGPFWLLTPGGPIALPEGGVDEWRKGLAANQRSDDVADSPRAYDARRLFQRIRDEPSLCAIVAGFERDLCRRGFGSPPADRTASPRLLETESLDAVHGLSTRALLAWLHVFQPLLASRECPIERSWQEMSDEELREYLKSATKAQLVLLNRPTDRHRARELTDDIADYLQHHAVWDVADEIE